MIHSGFWYRLGLCERSWTLHNTKTQASEGSNKHSKCYEEASVNLLYQGKLEVVEIFRGMFFSAIPAEGTFSNSL